MELSEDDFWARLAIEAGEMRKEEPNFQPIDGNTRIWRGFMIGTGLYSGGVFQFEIHVPRSFPFKPPKVKVLTPIWHPNIFKDRICVGILGKDWTPASNLVDVVESLRFLLSNPNPDDPLNTTAAKEFKNSNKEFERKAKLYVEKYATWDALSQ
ncbi:MAG: ubiquitin-conjugating enzyme E2 [Candidatus Heimdallarchaeota archaeon]|nr:ubiquitin-conjugating enzyme E2 [Candidatus Heimdallarchaeota archaeon]